jgi:catechol 2,3-dioxygenase-like lactoylglutathione lyase family enzyme
MKRLHVHVAVDNLADSIKFYSGMFSAEPAVIKSDAETKPSCSASACSK